MSTMSVEEYAAAQGAEYSEYVAKERIFVGGALAFNEGDPVPKGHVDRGVVAASQVAKTSTKAAAQAQAANPTSPKGE